MTNKRKIEVLEKARAKVQGGYVGMCYAVISALTDDEYDEITFLNGKLHPKLLLSYFGIEKPTDAIENSAYWFRSDEHGQKRRIEILTNAINKLKS